MLSDWLYIGIFIIVALLLPAIAIVLAGLLAPKKPNEIKNTIYECGIETVGDNHVQFRTQYYLFALLFLPFDVEIVFLFPWAVAYGKLGLFGVLEGILFLIFLAAGLLYAWKKGELEWA